MLAYRPHSSTELKTKLTDKGYDRETIERALHRLQDLVRHHSFLLLSRCYWCWEEKLMGQTRSTPQMSLIITCFLATGPPE
jgi:hypothetical protein